MKTDDLLSEGQVENSYEQKAGFDNEKYLKEQTAEILKRVKRFDNKLYLELNQYKFRRCLVKIYRSNNLYLQIFLLIEG